MKKFALAFAVFLSACGGGGSSPTTPIQPQGPPDILGAWTLRQEAPTSTCALPSSFRVQTFPATITGGPTTYQVTLSDPTITFQAATWAWIGPHFLGGIAYNRSVGPLFATYGGQASNFTIAGGVLRSDQQGNLSVTDLSNLITYNCTGLFALTLTRR